MNTNQSHSIVNTVDEVRHVLNVFCRCGFCTSYRLGPDPLPMDRRNKKKQEPEPVIIVDELDVSNHRFAKKSYYLCDYVLIFCHCCSKNCSKNVPHCQDEALADGGTVDFLVSVLEPVTLGSALQITGEQSRFSPDLIGPTLAALWEDKAGLSCTWETYFVDSTYRPNPKDFFPNEQLLQYTLQVLAT